MGGSAKPTRRRVAVIGGGASGLLTAWMLQDEHDVVVYEADDRLGGHVHTVPVEHDDRETVYAEAGFKYFFDRTNPNMRAVFDRLGMAIEWTEAAMTLPHPRMKGDLVLPPRTARQLALLLTAPAALRDLVCLSTLRLAYDEVVPVGARCDGRCDTRGETRRGARPRSDGVDPVRSPWPWRTMRRRRDCGRGDAARWAGDRCRRPRRRSHQRSGHRTERTR